MKVKVDQDKCIACGACVAIAPLNFDFDATGLSTVINDEVTDKTRNAIEACPVYAISIDEEEQSEKKCECINFNKCGDACECGHSQEDEEELKEAA